MNKYKKIATAVVATVMAGSMVVSLAACGPNDGGRTYTTITKTTPTRTGTADSDAANNKTGVASTVSKQATLTPAASYDANQALQLAIGYNNEETGINYSEKNISDLKGASLAGTPAKDSLKPAWKALESKLGVKFTNKWYGADSQASKNISKLKTEKLYDSTNILIASANTITTAGAADELLDISNYLDEMPNYKAFLKANPVVWASLLADTNGTMYMLPYFDGNDDIEKYVLMRKDFVETLLDGKTGEELSTNTFEHQAGWKNTATTQGLVQVVGGSATVTSFMGKTGHWEVGVTDPSVLSGTPKVGSNKSEVTSNATTTIKIDYDKALADAKASTEGSLGAILATVEGVEASDISGQTSGNIVDIMNVAINKSVGKVTGGQLVQLLRRYIDVAYLTTADASFYAQTGLKRSDVFNGACAAWDADLYAALGRCFVTSGSMFGADAKDEDLLYLIAGRQYTTQRTTDVSSLAGELYGVRGLESRNNYTYISENGEVQDARNKAGTWEALQRMNDLALEGLFNTADNIANNNASHSGSGNTGIQTLSLHDYVQTQTSAKGFSGDANYNFAPIVTPVSVWNVDGKADTQLAGRTDGKETIMRFTESWRGVKDGGLVVNLASVADVTKGNDGKITSLTAKNNGKTLAAVLKFIDYCYSDEGQITMTYGSHDTTNNGDKPTGTWYGTKLGTISEETITWETGVDALGTYAEVIGTYDGGYTHYVKADYKGKAFVYDGVIYSGTYYNGRQIPTMTKENTSVFNNTSKNNFTNHARQYLGTTLPCFNKDQGFEYQCTAECGKVGAAIVNIALNNGTIKHQYQTLNGTTDGTTVINKVSGTGTSYWYTLVPTLLPYSKENNAAISGDLKLISGAGADNDNIYVNTSKTTHNLLLDVMYYGFDSSVSLGYVTSQTLTLPANVSACIKLNTDNGLNDMIGIKAQAWANLLVWAAANNVQ